MDTKTSRQYGRGIGLFSRLDRDGLWTHSVWITDLFTGICTLVYECKTIFGHLYWHLTTEAVNA